MSWMMWQHPPAWLGALSVALPIAIHLLGRGRAKVYRFPTLQFLRTSRLLPTRRTRIHDPLLLALRAAVLLAAAGALAQPLLTRSGRAAEVQRRLVRAVVVDTSASMRAVSDSAARAARRFAAEAAAATTIETATPDAGIQAASTWLARQPGRRELIVVSDFARDVIDSSSIASVPANIGIRLVPVAAVVDRSTRVLAIRGDTAIAARLDITDDGLSVRWSAERASSVNGPRVLGTPQDIADAAAAMRAARNVGVPATYESTHDIALALPGYADRVSLSDSPPRMNWMIDVLTRLSAELPHGTQPRAVERDSDSRHELIIFCDSAAASLRCASIISGVLRANTSQLPVAELEPSRIANVQLARWERAPGAGTDVRRAGDWLTGPSDARWLWAVALLLLGVETVVRRDRTRAEDFTTNTAHDLAA